MSQVAELPESVATESYEEPQQIAYRPVPVSAVVAIVLGVLSSIALLGLTGAIVAILGMLVSVYSLIRILASRGDLGGKIPAGLGLLLSLGFLAAGVAYQVHLYRTEVPEGFQRVSFSNELSAKGFLYAPEGIALHPDLQPLVGQKLFLKGYMYPTQQTTDLPNFLLVEDSGTCCFGGEPKLEDMIGVIMEEGKTANHYAGKVSVAGELMLNTQYSGQNKLEPIFLMKGHLVSKSKTDLE
jgi:hypothetical protein